MRCYSSRPRKHTSGAVNFSPLALIDWLRNFTPQTTQSYKITLKIRAITILRYRRSWGRKKISCRWCISGIFQWWIIAMIIEILWGYHIKFISRQVVSDKSGYLRFYCHGNLLKLSFKYSHALCSCGLFCFYFNRKWLGNREVIARSIPHRRELNASDVLWWVHHIVCS